MFVCIFDSRYNMCPYSVLKKAGNKQPFISLCHNEVKMQQKDRNNPEK